LVADFRATSPPKNISLKQNGFFCRRFSGKMLGKSAAKKMNKIYVFFFETYIFLKGWPPENRRQKKLKEICSIFFNLYFSEGVSRENRRQKNEKI